MEAYCPLVTEQTFTLVMDRQLRLSRVYTILSNVLRNQNPLYVCGVVSMLLLVTTSGSKRITALFWEHDTKMATIWLTDNLLNVEVQIKLHHDLHCVCVCLCAVKLL